MSNDPTSKNKTLTRFALTGFRHHKWTTRAAKLLHTVFVKPVKAAARAVTFVGAQKLQGNEKDLSEQAGKLVATAADAAVATVAKPVIEERLKIVEIQKCEEEAAKVFAERELLALEMEARRAEIAAKNINNAQELVELVKELDSLTKTQRQAFEDADGNLTLVFADAPLRIPPQKPLTLEDMGLCSRVRKCLSESGVEDLDDLCSLSRSELLAIKGIGPASVAEIEKFLGTINLSLKNE